MMTARKRVHPFLTRILENRKRFHYLASSLCSRHRSSLESSSRDFSYDSLTSSSERPSHLPTTHSPTSFSLDRPSRKRCRGLGVFQSHYQEDSIEGSMGIGSKEEDIDSDVLADIEADIAAEATTAIEFRVETDVGFEGGNEVEEDAESSARDTVEIRIDRVIEPEIPDDTHYLSLMRDLWNGYWYRGGAESLGGLAMTEEAERTRLLNKIRVLDGNEQEDEHGDDHENGGENGNGNGNGNGMGRGNEDRNPNMNAGDFVLVARECTYQDFLKCQPLSFKGTEGVVGLTRCALTWWNSYKRTIRTDVVYAMTWKVLMKLMTEGNDLTSYTHRFQELVLLCTKMVLEEEDQVEKFIGGLLDNIQGNGYAARNAENKMRFDNNQRVNCADKSFVSTTFSALLDVVPSILDVSYAVKLADERVTETDIILKGGKEEAAFQMLKQKLCSATILDLPEGSENSMVYCDASHKGLGASLQKVLGTRCWDLRAFNSRNLIADAASSLGEDCWELNVRSIPTSSIVFPLPVMCSHCQKKFPLLEESSHCQKKFPLKIDHQYPTLAKIPVLDTGKFEQWQFRIQQYLQLEHYALWEVIEFGDSYKAPTSTDSAESRTGRTITPTPEDMQKKKNDVKARTTLLLSLPDEHQLRFSKYKTARELWAVILKTFGDIEKDDLNQKFLTSLAPEWLIHTIVWRNKNDLDSMSLDDLYNHLKVYEAEVQKKPNSNSHDMAFISSSKNSNNEDGNTICVTTATTAFPTGSVNVATISQDTASAFIASQSNGS
uniref:Reverse transcriptase/retrotransposon-derived protein RNase H-like domain-containing protein n=1 Tax=Tanacetum cinerariifolium TaxID=118510 RepID=A0A6L2M7H8_TANCI|nr:hypothetical protein [Tanacetum cinerariifolium]